MQVHKENIDKVPNALPNRNSVDIEVYGMEGIPPGDVLEHERTRGSDGGSTSSASTSLGLSAQQGLLPRPVVPTGLLGATPQMPPGLPTGLPIGPPPGIPPLGFPGMSFPPPMHVPPGQLRHPFSFPPPPMMMMPPTSGPPSGIPMPPTTTQSPVAFQMNLPRKPLFPAAASALLSQPPPSGPPLPSSSYSAVPSSSSSSSKPPVEPTGPLVPPTNSTARIVHPQEDLSLEELRSRHPKYQLVANNFDHNSSSNDDNNGLLHTLRQEIVQ